MRQFGTFNRRIIDEAREGSATIPHADLVLCCRTLHFSRSFHFISLFSHLHRMLARLSGHLSRYAGASLLLTVASLISFPILTRMFSVEQYGLLSYVGLVLTMLVGLAKLGMQHAAVRFRSEVETRGETGVNEYVATVIYGMALAGLAVTLIWAGVSQVLPDAVWNHPLMKPLLLLTSSLVFLRTVESAFVNLLKADERSGALGVFTVVRRYVELVVILLTLFFVSRTLVGFYVATIAVQVLGLAVLVVWYCRRQPVSLAAFSPGLLKTMLAYSIPMIGFELASVVLSLGDRYVIQSRLGAADLGIYSAAYNLSDYIRIVLITSVASAVMPVYLRLYEQEGEARTLAFLGQVLHFYLLVAVPVVAGLAVVGEPLVALVASSKYAPGAAIIPWVMAGMALEGLLPVVGAALYIRKQSKVILKLVVIAAVVNILANLWLVPVYGIAGAAWATFGSYGLMLVLALFASRGELRLAWPWLALCRFVGAALLMAWVLSVLSASVAFSAPAFSLLAQVLLGTTVYGALMFALDPEARRLWPFVLNRLKAMV